MYVPERMHMYRWWFAVAISAGHLANQHNCSASLKQQFLFQHWNKLLFLWLSTKGLALEAMLYEHYI